MRGKQKVQRAEQLRTSLQDFHERVMPLHGIAQPENMLAFVAQIIDSLHRIEYVQTIRRRPISANRINPHSPFFDPIRAAVLISRDQPEEAFWLVFLATHCGPNIRTNWLLASELYGAWEAKSWSWARVLADPQNYANWIDHYHDRFQGKFGNHRKYESLKPGPKGTSAVVRSYVEWIKGYGSHVDMVAQAQAQAQGSPRRAFGLLYEQMESVQRFGRTGKFDYLTMLGKVGLANIDADSTYINDATGPKRGARLLFDGRIDSHTNARTLEGQVHLLERHLGVGMQVMEDATCNWQKSPSLYQPFRG